MLKRTTPILALCFAALFFTGAASAQNGGGKAGQQQAQQMMKQYRQKASKLQQIHEKTIDANPQLAAEQKKFQQQVRQAVQNEGYDVDKGQKRMKQMAKRLQSGKLSNSQRQQVMKQFKSERQKMVSARNAALRKPDIQAAGKKLQQDTLAAMKKQNSQTESLLNDMKSLRGKIRSAQGAPAKASQSDDG